MGAGASMVLGTAGVLLSSALFAGEVCTPAGCTPTSPSCQQCDQVFMDAAAKLKNLDPGCCTPAASACAAPAPSTCCPAETAGCCEPDAVFDCGEKKGWDEFTLMSLFEDECGNNALADKGYYLNGFTQFKYSNNPDGAFAGNSQTLDDRVEWDRFALNQQYFRFGKTATTTECKNVDWGFGVDAIYGLDGNDAQAFGNPAGSYDFLNGWDYGSYEWALPQLYGEVAVDRHTAKIGHFYTLLGYEVVPATGNFFTSAQLTFYNSEPFTHTGAIVATKINEKLTVHNGWVLGMDTGYDQLADGNAYHGGFIFNATDATSITFMTVTGDLGWRGNGSINSLILSHKWTDKLQTVHQFDVLGTDLVVAPGVASDFAVNGIAHDSIGQINYAFYEINDKLKAGVRQEWYKADSVSYYTFTYGVNIKPTNNLLIRPEVRHMSSPANNGPYTGVAGDRVENLYNQTVFGVDAILTY